MLLWCTPSSTKLSRWGPILTFMCSIRMMVQPYRASKSFVFVSVSVGVQGVLQGAGRGEHPRQLCDSVRAHGRGDGLWFPADHWQQDLTRVRKTNLNFIVPTTGKFTAKIYSKEKATKNKVRKTVDHSFHPYPLKEECMGASLSSCVPSY